MSDPLVAGGLALLALALLFLIIATVLAIRRFGDWRINQRTINAEIAYAQKIAAKRVEQKRVERELELARSVEAATAHWMESAIALAHAQDRVRELEDLLARKERMRSIYWRRIKRLKEAGLAW